MTIGLTSSLTAWVWLPLLVIATAIGAWWGYLHTTPELSRFQRLGLSSLRGLALALTVFALAGIEITLQRHYQRMFKLGVVLDGSESMTLSDRLGSRREAVNKVLSSLSRKPVNSVALVSDSIVTGSDASQMWASNWLSANYSSAKRMFHSLDSTDSKPDGFLWITDGAVEEGDAIPYPPDKPVWTMAIGDTLPPPNAYVGDPDIPMRAIAGKPMSVIVPIAAEGLAGRDASLEVTIAGGSTAVRNIKLPSDGTRDTVVLIVKPGIAGWKNLTVTLNAPVDSSLEDNRRTIPVFVRVAQLPVTIVYGALHPDVGTLRQSLEADSGFAVTVVPEARAMQPPTSGIVMLVHAPREGTPAGDAVARWAINYPRGLLWLSGSAGWSPTLSRAFSSSDLRYRGSGDVVSIVPMPVKERVLSTNSTEPDWSRLPPVAGRRNAFGAAANVVATFSGSEPAMLIQSGTANRIAVLIWDVWRWQQAPLETGRPAAVDRFWRSVAEYLGADRTKTFRAIPGRRYSVGVPSSLEAVWVSASGEPVSGGVVSVESEGIKILLEEREAGRFSGQWQPSRSGIQTLLFRGTASDNHSETDSIQIDVDRFSTERQHAIAYPNRLAGSAVTGGGLIVENRLPQLLDSLSNVQVEDRSNHSIAIWRSLFALIGLLLVLTLEWFWRSRIGML